MIKKYVQLNFPYAEPDSNCGDSSKRGYAGGSGSDNNNPAKNKKRQIKKSVPNDNSQLDGDSIEFGSTFDAGFNDPVPAKAKNKKRKIKKP